jgi:hypothetical protein
MAGAEGFLPERECALERFLRFAVLALRFVYEGKAVEGMRHVRAARAENLFPDRERALVEALRFAVLALLIEHEGEVGECFGDLGVIAVQDLLTDCQSVSLQAFRFGVFALRTVHDGQEIERGGVVRVIGPEPRLDCGLELLRLNERFVVVASLLERPEPLEDCIRIALLRHCGRHGDQGEQGRAQQGREAAQYQIAGSGLGNAHF